MTAVSRGAVTAVRGFAFPCFAANTAAVSVGPEPFTGGGVRAQLIWIGRWDVFLPNGNKAGENVIESIADGCALLESWTGGGGVTDKSVNMYDARDGRWHQTWVDSSGGRLELSGAFGDGRMVLASAVGEVGKPGDRSVQRITWSTNPDGSVRQLWEASDGGGATYRVAFDGRYVKRKE